MIAFKLDHAQLASQALGLDCYSAPGLFWSFFLSTDNSGVGSSHSRPQLAHSLPWLWAHGPTIIMLPFSSLGCVDRKGLGCIRQKNLGCVLSCLLLLGLLLAFLFLFFTPHIFFIALSLFLASDIFIGPHVNKLVFASV